MTLLSTVQEGQVPPEVTAVAREEGLTEEFVAKGIAEGRICVLRNPAHNPERVVAVGAGLRTKVNANLGTSSDCDDAGIEYEKLDVCMRAGSDTVMDLSTGGDIDAIRRSVLGRTSIPVGTVPIYQSALEAIRCHGSAVKMSVEDIFDTVRKHAADGVDFMTVHCGLTLRALERLNAEGRLVSIVSRGGAMLTDWMMANNSENPLFEYFDQLLEIAKEHDFVLSLGDSLRPGGIADATDRAQIEELLTLGELVSRAREAGVQAIVEGPGHVALHMVEANVMLQKRLCHNAPFYVLGPLVTDVAPGYDHITSAIGGALAAKAGADYLCYVTPSEHLCLPDLKDVKEGVIAARIAAHAADIAKGRGSAESWDAEMSKARRALDWNRMSELSIDPDRFREYRERSKPASDDVCTMCSDLCSMKMMHRVFKPEK